jgi:hypothetical protein
MTECFKKLPINIYPFIKPVEELLADWPKKRMDKLFDISLVNPELLDYFAQRYIKIRENFILWHWNLPGPIHPHTDGDWKSTDEIVKKRLCGINWNFTPGSCVEFYSTEGATPEFYHRGEYDFSTTWKNATKVIDVWDDEGPVLFNPQIPHNIKGPGRNRLSVTLRFYETYESLRAKLNV